MTSPDYPNRYPPVSDTEETHELVDLLARDMHSLWLRDRTDPSTGGGSQGDSANDGDTQIISFGELPDIEKEHFRKSATKALKSIHESGFLIEKQIASASSPDVACEEILMKLKSTVFMSVVELRSIWDARIPEHWARSPALYALLGQRILKRGEQLLAYDVLSEGGVSCPEDVRLKQLLALALARSGATRRANRIVSAMFDDGHTDGETLGILARN